MGNKEGEKNKNYRRLLEVLVKRPEKLVRNTRISLRKEHTLIWRLFRRKK